MALTARAPLLSQRWQREQLTRPWGAEQVASSAFFGAADIAAAYIHHEGALDAVIFSVVADGEAFSSTMNGNVVTLVTTGTLAPTDTSGMPTEEHTSGVVEGYAAGGTVLS